MSTALVSESASQFLLDALIVLLVLVLLYPLFARLGLRALWVGRRLRRRLEVRRARQAFRAALRAARRHPELVDLERLHAAAHTLHRIPSPDAALAAVPELQEAIRHPYGPIRQAALKVIQTPGPSASSSSRTPSAGP
ncbi:MAG: hypothetical protein KatS3mg102_1440 [Planctomycetota bacterium]|nr:MAG: hypothetical protein KatS3mg102_1440 [Planctomycetota bacterium]